MANESPYKKHSSGVSYFWDTNKSRVQQVKDIDDLSFQKKVDRGLLATEEDYNKQFGATDFDLWYNKQDAGTQRKLQGEAEKITPGGVVYNWDEALGRLREQSPETLSQFGYTPTNQATFHQTGTFQDLASVARPGAGITGQQFSEEEKRVMQAEGRERFTEETGGFQGEQPTFLYGADVLDKKANDASVNALYNAYFNRDASSAELANWGARGGADTTVRALESFLQGERASAEQRGVTLPEIGQLGGVVQGPEMITLGDGTTARRDLGVEQKALSDYVSKTGKAPTTPEEWQEFHEFAYGDKEIIEEQEPTDPDTITSESITPGQEYDFSDTAPGTTFPIDSLNDEVKTPEIEATEQEEKQSDLMEEIQSLYDQTLGESEFRAEKEDEAGLDELIKIQNDLSSQLKMLKNEASSIPLQLEQDATGRGITTAILNRQKTAKLRDNAIQALGVSSLLEASQGNIATATALIDRAVEAEYGPIKEEIAVKLNNLELIAKDPKTSIQDKNRANAMAEILAKQEEQASLQAKEKDAVYNLALEAQKNGADAPLLQAILKAGNQFEAYSIGGELLSSDGWKYVGTPAERDNLINQGYEITQSGGRTYARQGGGADSTVQAYVNQIMNGSMKITSVPTAMRDDVVEALGDTPISSGGSASGRTPTKLTPEDEMTQKLGQVAGPDGFVSPEDYATARKAWVDAGLSPTVFDTKMRGFRNPNNPNYITTKASTSSSGGGGQTP